MKGESVIFAALTTMSSFAAVILMAVVLVAPLAHSQEFNAVSPYPHPVIETGISLADSLAMRYAAGVNLEQKYLILETAVSYANDRKTNDNTDGNDKGRDRSVNGAVFYKRNRWHYGAGFAFGQLATTNYTKENRSLLFGAGRDFIREDGFSWRLRAMYIPNVWHNEQTFYPDGTGCRCSNGSQGVDVGAWVPSPAAASHMFFHVDLAAARFHTTTTDPTNIEMTQEQLSHHSMTSWLRLGVQYRF